VIDQGTGVPLVLIPGIQGRWEWMAPAVDALAERCRVITFSLCGDPGSDGGVDGSLGFDSFVAQIDRAMEKAGIGRAAICGISLGGTIAVRYAALRPERTQALVLVSAPAPNERPSGLRAFCVRHPYLGGPLFLGGATKRAIREIRATFDDVTEGVGFAARHGLRVLLAPSSPRRMSERVRLWTGANLLPDCARIDVPTLLVTGEPGLDLVVPVESTLEYLTLIRGSRHVKLERTGHLGLVTRPRRFAGIVCGFVTDSSHRR
jgi:3-oxoadipate enol-lactonase/4-carboxymuconolactone decarboxylase